MTDCPKCHWNYRDCKCSSDDQPQKPDATPREWWIEEQNGYVTLAPSEGHKPFPPYVHVIEKSAYDALKVDADKHLEMYQLMAIEYGKANMERNALKQRVAELAVGAEAFMNMKRELTATRARIVERFDQERFLDIIDEWKCFWMNQRQNSKDDYDNYFGRAMGVDANMKYHLAKMLAEKLNGK